MLLARAQHPRKGLKPLTHLYPPLRVWQHAGIQGQFRLPGLGSFPQKSTPFFCSPQPPFWAPLRTRLYPSPKEGNSGEIGGLAYADQNFCPLGKCRIYWRNLNMDWVEQSIKKWFLIALAMIILICYVARSSFFFFQSCILNYLRVKCQAICNLF